MSIHRNGFTDPVVATMSEPAPDHVATAKSPQELRDAVAKRRFVDQMMTIKGSYGPRYVRTLCAEK